MTAVGEAVQRGLRMVTMLIPDHPVSPATLTALGTWNTRVLHVTPSLDAAASLIADVTAPAPSAY